MLSRVLTFELVVTLCVLLVALVLAEDLVSAVVKEVAVFVGVAAGGELEPEIPVFSEMVAVTVIPVNWDPVEVMDAETTPLD